MSIKATEWHLTQLSGGEVAVTNNLEKINHLTYRKTISFLLESPGLTLLPPVP